MSSIRYYLVSTRDAMGPADKPIHCIVLEAYSAADARTQWNVLLESGCLPKSVERRPLSIEPISTLDERLDAWRDDEHDDCLAEGARPTWHENRATSW
jgi:hypothetical protein